MDKYYEQLTPQYKSRLYGAYHYLSIGLAVIAAITIIPATPMAVIAAALAVLLYFVKQREFVEYEYIFTNGDIDIDKVIEAKKRKNIATFNMRDVTMLAPQESSHLKGAPESKKVLAYTKSSTGKVYVAVINSNNEAKKIYFTPDEDFINLCYRSNPKVVKT